MKVLFIGNSHTFVNDMPELLRQLAASRQIEIDAVQNTSGGRGLGWHTHEFDVRYNILFGRYDYVVLQHTAHPFPGEQNLFEEADKILKMVALSKSTPVAYQCWSEKNNPTGNPVICEAYEKLAHEQDMLLAPVGMAGMFARRGEAQGARAAGQGEDGGDECHEEGERLDRVDELSHPHPPLP